MAASSPRSPVTAATREGRSSPGLQGVGGPRPGGDLQAGGARIDGDEQLAPRARGQLQGELAHQPQPGDGGELPQLQARLADPVHGDAAQDAVGAVVEGDAVGQPRQRLRLGGDGDVTGVGPQGQDPVAHGITLAAVAEGEDAAGVGIAGGVVPRAALLLAAELGAGADEGARGLHEHLAGAGRGDLEGLGVDLPVGADDDAAAGGGDGIVWHGDAGFLSEFPAPDHEQDQDGVGDPAPETA